jgi:hypothetical protein
LREIGQSLDHLDQSTPNQFQRIPQKDQVCVIGDETTGRAQMNDRSGCGAGVAIGVYVCHDIVPQATLVLSSFLEVDVVHMLAQFFDLGVGYRESSLLFGFCQRHPEPTPGTELALVTPQVTHFT